MGIWQKESKVRVKVLGLLAGALVTVPMAADAAIITVDADSFAAGTVLNNAFPYVTLTALGDSGVLTNSEVRSAASPEASTGTNVFADSSGTSTSWGNGAFSYLRADFSVLVTQVWLDFVADDAEDCNPFLRAYDASNTLLASATGGCISPAGTGTTLSVSAASIAYITASWDETSKLDSGVLDNLRFMVAVPEPGTFALFGLGLMGLALSQKRKAA